MKRFWFLLVASLVLFVGQADAQPILPKNAGHRASGGMADGFYSHADRDDAGYYVGAALSTYTKGGDKWVFGGEYLQRYNPYKSTRIPTAQFTAEGGFYYNFLSDARKIFFFYVGGSALAGYGDREPGVDKTPVRRGGGSRTRMLSSTAARCRSEMEAYLADRIRPYGKRPRTLPVGRLHGAFPHAVRHRCKVHHRLTRTFFIKPLRK